MPVAVPEVASPDGYQGSLARRELLPEFCDASPPPAAISRSAASNVGGGIVHRRVLANLASAELTRSGASERDPRSGERATDLGASPALTTAATASTGEAEAFAGPLSAAPVPVDNASGPLLSAAGEIPTAELRTGNSDRDDSFRVAWIDCPRKFRQQLDFQRLFESIDFTSQGIGVQGTALLCCAAAVLTNGDPDSALTPEAGGASAASDAPPSGRG